MSVYHYRAYSASGEPMTGALEVDSIPTLDARLRASGAWLIEAKEGAAHAAEVEHRFSGVRVKRRDVIHFFFQMSLLLRAGINLPVALERLAIDSKETSLGVVVTGLSEQVAVGVTLHESMSKYPRVYSRQITAMIEAGEISGKLPEVFASLSKYYEWLEQLTADIRQALIYPMMVMSAALSFVLLLFTFVVPKFVSLLHDLSLPIPLLTRVVMSVSNALIHGWPVVVALLIGVPIGLKSAMRNERFARVFDRWLMDLPIFGELVAMFALSRFAHNLAMLYRSGIAILRGLEICREVVGNRAIAYALSQVQRGVSEGTPMHKCLAEHDVFPTTLVTMIATGETSGSLDFALQSVAEYYNAIIPRRIKIVFAIFDPLMMVSLIVIVGIVALSVVLPILQLWDIR